MRSLIPAASIPGASILGAAGWITVAFLLTGCPGGQDPNTTPEQTVLCELTRELFARDMDFEALHAEVDGECRALSEAELVTAGEREAFADDQCTVAVPYAGEPWLTFCRNQLLGDEVTKNYIGNPDAWGDLDPTVTTHIETRWNLSQGTTLHLMTVNQTEDRKRPYVKRVEYRRVDGCALGVHVYKTNPAAQNLEPMLLLHGGGWKYRGISAVAGIDTSAPNLTDRGYVVFAPFYRLLGDSDGPEACRQASGEEIVADVEAAFEWVFANGERYGMDPKWAQERKLSVMGQSAGGHLAAYLATHHPESVRRGLLLYPAPDLGFFTEEIKAGGIYDGDFLDSQGLLFQFFPQPGVTEPTEIDPEAPFVRRNSFPDVIQPDPDSFPALSIIHGDQDTTVPVELSVRLCQALDPAEEPQGSAYEDGDLERACGAKGELTVVAGADHILDLRCFAGRNAEVMGQLFEGASSLCPAGSRDGARQVREALEAAYAKF